MNKMLGLSAVSYPLSLLTDGTSDARDGAGRGGTDSSLYQDIVDPSPRKES